MTYTDALQFIDSSKRYGSRPGLERIAELCALAGDPQDAVPAVHVAGTNGKGSTSAMIASILSEAGYRTGLYTSPYVLDVRESMRIGGEEISIEEFASVASEIRDAAGRMKGDGIPPTEFELETAMAFLWFLRKGCGAAVIEAGLGGRLDATNVLKNPLASVLTSLSLDHTAVLGGTVAEIAKEKCGILKPGGIAVSYPLQPPEAMEVIREKARQTGNELILPHAAGIRFQHVELEGADIEYRGLSLRVPFAGRHQAYNAVMAAETALALRDKRGLHITDAIIADGIEKARMPLRQEVVHRAPLIMMDGAHNPGGLAALADTMKTLVAPRRTAVVMGMLTDKEYEKCIALIAPLCGKFIAAKPVSPRALKSSIAADCARRYCADVSVEDDLTKALIEAMDYAKMDGAVIVCGSLYLAGPMRKAFYDDILA